MKSLHALIVFIFLLISFLYCSFNNEPFEKIGFIVKGTITSEYLAKIDSIDPDNKKLNKLLYLIEFYNNDTSKYFVETYKGLICYSIKEIHYDSKGKVLSQSIGDYIPTVDLIQINPDEKKIFVSDIPIDDNAKIINLSYFVRKNSEIGSRMVVQFDFEVQD
jgi:hypothetical protein